MHRIEVRSTTEQTISTLLIESGALENVASRIHTDTYSHVVLIVDSGAAFFAPQVIASCGLSNTQILTISGGESCKELAQLERVWSFFLENGLDRKGLVIAMGGGAVTDLVGFAAATFMRGVACAYIPTTLLAQVDASIGGKSAINFGGLKNIVGNFQLPRVVVIDPATLTSLPNRELRSGFAEVIKHGALFDRAFFEEVTKIPCDSLSLSELTATIARSCELKAKIVNEDERELGPRKLLNFGHTLGHAFEALYLPPLDKKPSHGDKLLHGECVAIGMVAEAFISMELGFLSDDEFSLLESAILRSGLPIRLPSVLSVEEVLAATNKDKKREAMEIKWSLIEEIGRGVFNKLAPKDTVVNAIRYVLPVR